MQKTLADAGMTPDQIDHINAHGTATPENDKMEFQTASIVFGERAKQIPVTSNSHGGPYQSRQPARSKRCFSLLTLEQQRIPQTINYENPDPTILFNVVGNRHATRR